MLRTLTFDPFKVVLDTIQDYLCFLFTELLDNPLEWVNVLFLRVTRLASWHNVVGRIWSVGCDRDEMFLYQHLSLLMRRWTFTTVRACVVPVIKAALPIGLSEGGRQSTLASIAKLHLSASFLRMVFEIALVDNFLLVWICFLPAFNGFALLIWICIAPSFVPLTVYIGMFSSKPSLIFVTFVSMFIYVAFLNLPSFLRIELLNVLRMGIQPFFATCTYLVGMSICPCLIACSFAFKTTALNTIRTLLVFLKLSTVLQLPALAAHEHLRIWEVNHLKFSLQNLTGWCVDNLVRLGFQPVHDAGLVHATQYTTNRGVASCL